MPKLPSLRPAAGPETVAGSVTTAELFFDLAFVFTITQLTSTVGTDHGLAGVGRTVLLFTLMWWMYGGYAWLTNAAPPVTTKRRMCLLLAMIGNFMMALAIPHAFDTDRLVFASGYVLVVLVHAFLFLTESSRITGGMVLQLLGWNELAAALVLLGAFLGGTGLYVTWIAAVLVEVVAPRLAAFTPLARLGSTEGPGFTVRPAHFVERHGLMLIIAMGESVLAIGVGVSSGAERIGLAQIAFAAISLVLAATLYRAYFGTGEDTAAEHALAEAGPRQHAVALASFGYALAVMLLGVVFSASGLHHALEHPLHHLDVEWAAHLAGGVAAFWLGLTIFRLSIGRRDIGLRLVGGLALLATIPLGTLVSATAQLVTLLAGCVLLLRVERRQGIGTTR